MEPVEALDAALTQHLSAIRHAAISSPPGGGGEWDTLLRHYGHAAFDAQERAMIVSCMRLARGAVPAELRVVLIGLQGWGQRELDRLRAMGAASARPNVDALQHRIAMLVDAEVSAYEHALGVPPSMPAAAPAVPPAAPAAPAAPSLASIFANANQTAKEVPWAGQTYKSVVNLNCVHCGGPQEQPQDFMCKYCRRPIAGSIKPTA
jgi:hypothetical protein